MVDFIDISHNHSVGRLAQYLVPSLESTVSVFFILNVVVMIVLIGQTDAADLDIVPSMDKNG